MKHPLAARGSPQSRASSAANSLAHCLVPSRRPIGSRRGTNVLVASGWTELETRFRRALLPQHDGSERTRPCRRGLGGARRHRSPRDPRDLAWAAATGDVAAGRDGCLVRPRPADRGDPRPPRDRHAELRRLAHRLPAGDGVLDRRRSRCGRRDGDVHLVHLGPAPGRQVGRVRGGRHRAPRWLAAGHAE